MSAIGVIEQYEELTALRADWEVLGELSGSPFRTWAWAHAWWSHHGRGRQLVLGVARHADGRPRCIVPLFHAARWPCRVLRFVGHEGGDEMGPVCSRGDEVFAAAAVRQLLGVTRGWDLFLADRLPADPDWPQLLAGRLLASEPSPVLEHDGDWVSYLATRSRNARQNVRRVERRLQSGHDVTYRLAGAGTLTQDVLTLFRLHEARWGGESSFSRLREFHEDFIRLAAERGWLRLWLLELDGTPAAAWYGLRFGGDEWYYQAGREPALEQVSPGSALLAHSIAAALDDGVVTYRMLRGGEAYKQHFATGSPELQTIGVGRGVLGRTALLSLRAARRTRAGRQLLRAVQRLP